MLADAGSTPAASTKLRTSNIQGSPENPVNSGVFVCCSSVDFKEMFEAQKLETQRKIDEQMKNNKI